MEIDIYVYDDECILEAETPNCFWESRLPKLVFLGFSKFSAFRQSINEAQSV